MFRRLADDGCTYEGATTGHDAVAKVAGMLGGACQVFETVLWRKVPTAPSRAVYDVSVEDEATELELSTSGLTNQRSLTGPVCYAPGVDLVRVLGSRCRYASQTDSSCPSGRPWHGGFDTDVGS